MVPSITAGTLAGSDVAAFTQTFDSAAVATGKTLNPAGSVLDGNAGANYAVTFVTDTTGVITQRQITVTADTQTKTYGNDDPALTYQVSGVVAPGDGFTGSLTRAPGEDVGTYAITQGTLALTSDYDLVFVPAQLTVTQRPITVTAGTDTKGVRLDQGFGGGAVDHGRDLGVHRHAELHAVVRHQERRDG